MRVTVCELSDEPNALARDWERLVAHVKARRSELVLLPEMPFCPWFAATPVFDESVWQSVVASHDAWQTRLEELAPAIVLGTRPVNSGKRRLNEGFSWSKQTGYRIAHHKYHLPNEDDFWEAAWYQPGDGGFSPIQCADAMVGFEICTELWVMENARLYGKEGVHIIVTPRATPKASLEKWLVAGRAAAIISGAFSLSSNHSGAEQESLQMGGQGWIISPEGEVLGLTSNEQPFVTAEIPLKAAELAKGTYPRYVLLQ
jgi:N-carbamoylputrescine amidase